MNFYCFSQFSLFAGVCLIAASAQATPLFTFSTGDPDGLIGTATRPSSAGRIEIETGDDFILTAPTSITNAAFTGLLTGGATANDIGNVRVEIYRVFPNDSQDPPSGHVPTRVNSPSDVALDERDAAGGTLTFSASVLDSNFTVNNSVVNGINSIPGQTTGGEGPASGVEILITVDLTQPFTLPADHYFFVPQVAVNNGEFLWLSAPKPIVSPGTPFNPDLQSWIRDENLAPDWLRIGTDIVGGSPAPTFNASFSLIGQVPEPSTTALMLVGMLSFGGYAGRALLGSPTLKPKRL